VIHPRILRRPFRTFLLVCSALLIGSGCTGVHFPPRVSNVQTARSWEAKSMAEEKFVLARAYDMAGDPKKALALYESAYRSDPQSQPCGM
jgi:hypothetical protein